MNAAEKIAHAAERKAFEAMRDSLIRKSQTKDVCTVANDFVNMVQKIHSSVWTPETFEMLHQIANDPDSKWYCFYIPLFKPIYYIIFFFRCHFTMKNFYMYITKHRRFNFFIYHFN